MASKLDIWITSHRDLADDVFSAPTLPRIESIRERLGRLGYSLKLDIGKRSTRATVTSKTLRAKTTYRSLDGFMAVEEARLAEMEAITATPGA